MEKGARHAAVREADRGWQLKLALLELAARKVDREGGPRERKHGTPSPSRSWDPEAAHV